MFAITSKHKRTRTRSLDRGSLRKTPRVEYSVPTGNRFNVLKNNNQDPVVKPAKPAPITVTNDPNIIETLKLLNVQFRIKIVSVGTKVYVDNEADFKTVCNNLREKKVEFFSHPFGNSKTFKLLLCGLPEFATSEITECLKTQNNVSVSKINMLSSEGSFKRYILQFDPSENSKADIINIKVILHHVVKWLPTRPHKKGPTQCLNCGMFGHGVSACNRAPKCNLCGEGHPSDKCSFNSDEDSQRIYKCHNCKANNLQHNHRANDIECPMRSKNIEIKAAMNKRKIQTAYGGAPMPATAPLLTPAPMPPPLTRSFANVARQRTFNQFDTSSANAIANMPIQQANIRFAQASNNAHVNNNDLFSFAEVSEILFNCVNELQQCTSKLDQIKVIAKLLNHVCK